MIKLIELTCYYVGYKCIEALRYRAI